MNGRGWLEGPRLARAAAVSAAFLAACSAAVACSAGQGASREPPGPAVVAGGDAAVLMHRSAAGEALIRYLASPQAAAIWAAAGKAYPT